MKKVTLNALIIFLLFALIACSGNNESARFNQWELVNPKSELLYHYSSENRGFHGDGVDCYIYTLSQEYREYLNDYFMDNDILITKHESTSDLSSNISNEILQIESTEALDYLNKMKNFNLALILNSNDKLIIIIDEVHEEIAFIFSLY